MYILKRNNKIMLKDSDKKNLYMRLQNVIEYSLREAFELYGWTIEEDKPVEGKIYSLTGLGNSIMNGNSWSESEVKE